MLIAENMGFKGEIRVDKTKPDGQMRRELDCERADERFGWHARTSLLDGLPETIEWYRANRKGT